MDVLKAQGMGMFLIQKFDNLGARSRIAKHRTS
jgi:hypothetical protein